MNGAGRGLAASRPFAFLGAVCAAALVGACGHPGAGRQPLPASSPRPSASATPAAISETIQGVRAEAEGQRDRAVALFREAVAKDPRSWEARYDLGVVLAKAGDLAEAEGHLAAAAKEAPDAEDVALALAEVRRRRGQAKLAAEGLADFVRDHASAVAARMLYLATLRESGQLDKAIAEAREVLVRKPSDPSALGELSLAYLAKGEKDAAALLAKQALEAGASTAIAHRAMGLIDLANGDDAAAFSELRKAAQADPRDTTSRSNMGVVLLRAGAYAKAEVQYREILRVAPDDADAMLGLAAALRGQADAQHPQRLVEAQELLQKILQADPHDSHALFNLGVLYADFLKRPADAAPLFARYLAETPSDDPSRAKAERYAAAANAAANTAAPAPTTPAPAAPGHAAAHAPPTSAGHASSGGSGGSTGKK